MNILNMLLGNRVNIDCFLFSKGDSYMYSRSFRLDFVQFASALVVDRV